MTIQSTVVGSYPKPPDEGQTFTVRKTLHALERGDARVEDLYAAHDELARAVISEHESASIDVITDGHVRWDDLLTPFARHMSGFEIGGLLRWFDNNVYYRRPICTGPVEWHGPSSVSAFQFAQSVASKPVKAVIPGAFTFARLSVNEHYAKEEDFVLAIARVLAQEAFELEAAGARHIQIDEPAFLEAPEELDLVQEATYIVTSQLQSAETTLATYFGDAKRIGPQIFDLPVNGFGFDLVSGPENVQLVRELPPEKHLQAGIVDARNTRLEQLDDVAREIEELAAIVGPESLRVSPSAGLEFLPREKARAKLERLAEAVRKVN